MFKLVQPHNGGKTDRLVSYKVEKINLSPNGVLLSRAKRAVTLVANISNKKIDVLLKTKNKNIT